ncbi:MAG TPA: sodium:solute symporter, partial [Saprospirales bacterium]|nr:sodium:solute symporter [Saprospirales bacterium]
VFESFRQANLENNLSAAQTAISELQQLEAKHTDLRKNARELISSTGVKGDGNDKDYVFIQFILSHIPVGVVGLMLAMIFCASWSTTASELSALSATSISDVYRRLLVPGQSDEHYLKVSKLSTILWGAFIVVFAYFASLAENLIQAVNMIGSMFYGTILGIFFTAFFLKPVKGRAVFYAAVMSEVIVLICFWMNKDAFLWYNPLGCGLVMIFGWIIERLAPQPVVATR